MDTRGGFYSPVANTLQKLLLQFCWPHLRMEAQIPKKKESPAQAAFSSLCRIVFGSDSVTQELF